MLTTENNSLHMACTDHPNAVVIPITNGTHQCMDCLTNEVTQRAPEFTR